MDAKKLGNKFLMENSTWNCPCNSHNKGILQKGQKSSITKFYEIKCKEAFNGDLPLGWLPQSVIIEGMFIINAIPIKIHKK